MKTDTKGYTVIKLWEARKDGNAPLAAVHECLVLWKPPILFTCLQLKTAGGVCLEQMDTNSQT
jgi:hypothetical protein